MKKTKLIFNVILSCRFWLAALICMNLFFIFVLWLAVPEALVSLSGLMALFSACIFLIPVVWLVRQQFKIQKAFFLFLSAPEEMNEYALSELLPPVMQPYIQALSKRLRQQQSMIKTAESKQTDYENYIENWVHEIKKPLSLITLILDNRKDEIAPPLHARLSYAKDAIRHDTEQILYFSRLKASHKDYRFEPLPLLSVCQEAVSDNRPLLNEAGFAIEFTGSEQLIISDKKGLMFIFSQLISNSVKYAKGADIPVLCFSVRKDNERKKIILDIKDNGPGLPPSDLPFIFDKGFTGEQGSYLSRSTGMGLYLVKKMADDLSVGVTAFCPKNGGIVIRFEFPVVTL